MKYLERLGQHRGHLTLLCLGLASLLVWIAFLSRAWLHSGGGRSYGLWVVCYDARGSHECQAEYGGAFWDKWAAVQATATLGFLGTNVALTFTVMYMFVERFKHNHDLAAATGIICICTDILYLCGLLIIFLDFTSEFELWFDPHAVAAKPKTGYSYTLSWFVVILGITSGVLMIKESGIESSSVAKRHYQKVASEDDEDCS